MKPSGFQRNEILLVQDSSGDILLIQDTLDSLKIVDNLHIIRNGVEALAFLRREGRFKDSPRPGIILLDLNLPRKDGREVLAEIKNDEKLKRIPVVVLTTSRSEADVMQAYGLHANCYVVKPLDPIMFKEVVRSIANFWFAVVKLPTVEKYLLDSGVVPKAASG